MGALPLSNNLHFARVKVQACEMCPSAIDLCTPIVSCAQVRDRLPNLKAIVQFTKEVAEKDPMVYDVSVTSLTLSAVYLTCTQ